MTDTTIAKRQRTNKYLQNTTLKTNDWATGLLKTATIVTQVVIIMLHCRW